MTYARKVEIQRERNRVTEERRKAAKRRAKNSGQGTRLIVAAPEGEPSIWRRTFDAVTGKAAAKICDKCGTRNTLKQLEKHRGCLKCRKVTV